MELFLVLIKLTAAVVISLAFFLFSLKLLVNIIFAKVDSDEYEERLTTFLNKRSIVRARKLNRV